MDQSDYLPVLLLVIVGIVLCLVVSVIAFLF